MYLTTKTEKAMKKIINSLEPYYTLEIIGNQILTPNCTIEVNRGAITVNEVPVFNNNLQEVYSIIVEEESRNENNIY